MEAKTFIQVFINSETDLPKEKGRYISCFKESDITKDFPFYNTKEEAINFLISKKQAEIDRLISQIKYKEEELGKIKEL